MRKEKNAKMGDRGGKVILQDKDNLGKEGRNVSEYVGNRRGREKTVRDRKGEGKRKRKRKRERERRIEIGKEREKERRN